MRKRMSLAVVLFVFGCSPLSTLEAPSDGTAPEITPAGVTAIDEFLQASVSEGSVPNVVAVVANSRQILYEGAFGKSDVARDIDARPDSLYRIASMIKPVTSVAIMMLEEEGALHLDDPISMYFPELANRSVLTDIDEVGGSYETEPAESEVTIRQLLSQTGGLAYSFSSPRMQRLQQLAERPSAELPLIHQPGTVWNYSAGPQILGNLVEEISGMPLDEFFRIRIFEPLGMDDIYRVVPAEMTDRVVTVHRRVDGDLVEDPNPETIVSAMTGAGGMLTTASEYARFLQMFLNEGQWEGRRLLQPASVDAMTQNQIGPLTVTLQRSTSPALSRDFPLGVGTDKFGLGFQITNADNPNLRSRGSLSWAGLYNTHFWVDPARDIAAVILMQVLPFFDETAIAIYQGFEERLYRNLM